MPKSSMKVKSGSTYEVAYKVVGSMDELTTDQLKVLAERQLRTSARSAVLSQLNEVEPAIAANLNTKKEMLAAGFPVDLVETFFKNPKYVLVVPTSFEIPMKDLIPEESGRGKKAADIFSFESTDESGETSTENEVEETTE
jgi:hypothetical protein